MDERTRKIMTSSKNEHWNSPGVILDPLDQHLGPILLDPCSNGSSIVKAVTEWHGPAAGGVDGLTQPWQVSGLVYVNPPYGRKIRPWIQKCVDEAGLARAASNDTEIVLLGPARTDTKWFQRLILPSADSVLLWEGRLTFAGAKDPAVFPSFLAYWGHRPLKFKVAFVGKGWYVK